MIPDIVDERLRVLHTDTESKALGLDFPSLPIEKFINVAGRMSGCKYQIISTVYSSIRSSDLVG